MSEYRAHQGRAAQPVVHCGAARRLAAHTLRVRGIRIFAS